MTGVGLLRALIIEDEVLIAFMIEDALRELGYSVFATAATFSEAVSVGGRFEPDLITADARLAEGCGIDAALELCRETKIPIVFVTGNGEKVRARLRDPIVVEKPFSAEAFARAVSEAVARPGVSPLRAS